MTSAATDSPRPIPSRARRRLFFAAAGALPLLIVLALVAAARARRPAPGAVALFEVTRGPLVISVSESGVIQSRDKHIIRNKVDGHSTIVSLIEEGTHVKAGDLLIELDASRFDDARVELEIRLQSAEAALINASETLAVVSNQVQADVEKADLDLRFARMDCEKFVKGETPQQRRQLEADITMAREELQRAGEKAAWSRKLADEGYITRAEMEADEFAQKRSQINLALATGKLDLATMYTESQQLAKLESGIKQAEMALERARRKARADTVQAQATFHARTSEFDTSRKKMENLREAITNCRITATAEGMVVYAQSQDRYHRSEPLAVGVEVSERQELIHLPATETMSAEIKIPEASVTKIREGMPARIRVDALPDRLYQGHMAKIGLMPDTVRAWLNPDLKVYNCEIYVDSVARELRPGMSCRVELIVEEYESAISVPVQCVVRVKDRPSVYVMASREPQPRDVETGLDNGRLVRIIRGLEPGEKILLAPPLPPSTVEEKPVAQEEIGPPDDSVRAPADPGAPPAVAPDSTNRPAPSTPPQRRRRERPPAAL